MKKSYYLLGCILLLIGCSSSETKEKQNWNDLIIGEWIEVSPCESCNILTFSLNDTIYLKKQSDERIYKIHYKVQSEDSIKVTRIWEIEESKKTTNHEVEFLDDDRLLLKQFMPVDYGVTGFEDIKLMKLE